MEVVITEDASEDIAEGYEFYEEQAVGLGADFASFIMSELYSLTKLAGIAIYLVIYRLVNLLLQRMTILAARSDR